VELQSFGGGGQMLGHRRRLCEILQARCEEILEMIFSEVRQAGYDEMISAGLVLTGGSANLPGFMQLARDVLNMPVRIGYPAPLAGLADSLANPAYATGVGLLHWAMREGGRHVRPAPAASQSTTPRLLSGVRRMIRGFLPE
jgi:cell division protein FtsA